MDGRQSAVTNTQALWLVIEVGVVAVVAVLYLLGVRR
jgi:hypothetical protein